MSRKIYFLHVLLLLISLQVQASNNDWYFKNERMSVEKYHNQRLPAIRQGLIQNSSSSPFSAFLTNIANSNFVLSEEISEAFFDPENVLKDKSEYLYDSSGKNSQIMRYRWENSDWMLTGRGNLTYDAQGREVELINQTYMESAWSDWYRETTTYNSAGKIAEVVGYYISTNGWLTSWRTVNNYDDNNMLIESHFDWADGDSWNNGDIYEYKYDENGRLVEESYKYFDSNVWNNAEIYLYTYDQSGNLIETLTRTWNGSLYENSYKMVSSYNSDKKEVSSLGYNLEGSNWRNNTRWDFTYDENNNLTENVFSENWAGNGWSVLQKTTMSYIELVTSIEDTENSTPIKFSLSQNYPNPFNPETIINYSVPEQSYITIKIFDVTGSEVATLLNGMRERGSYQQTFDASRLSSGIYFYTLKTDNFKESKKMILTK